MLPNNENLHEVMRQNDLITYAYSYYLNRMPRFLTAEMVEGLANDCQLDTHEAFMTLFTAACGFDTAADRSHRELERVYIRTGVHRLDPTVYQNDPYYRMIAFPPRKSGKWEMCEHFYTPYEAFVCNHPVLTPDFREIPQIGYFAEEFRFPAILENGIEWMTVTPNEIETMRTPIESSSGKVLTLGLGLGYFAFRVSEKAEVESVTVVERDKDVIELFHEFILPQFPHAHKIEIVQADALEFMKAPDIASRFDYIFADLWHDQSDGLPLYLQLRRMEKQSNIRRMDYWIEPTLLSTMRHMVYDKLNDGSLSLQLQGASQSELLTDEFLRGLAPDLRRME